MAAEVVDIHLYLKQNLDQKTSWFLQFKSVPYETSRFINTVDLPFLTITDLVEQVPLEAGRATEADVTLFDRHALVGALSVMTHRVLLGTQVPHQLTAFVYI